MFLTGENNCRNHSGTRVYDFQRPSKWGNIRKIWTPGPFDIFSFTVRARLPSQDNHNLTWHKAGSYWISAPYVGAICRKRKWVEMYYCIVGALAIRIVEI